MKDPSLLRNGVTGEVWMHKEDYLFIWLGKHEVRCARLEQHLLSFLQIAYCTEISPVIIISGLIRCHCIRTPSSALYPNCFHSRKRRFIPKHLIVVGWEKMHFQKILRRNTNGSGRGSWHQSVTLLMVGLFFNDNLWEVRCILISEHG